jgi:rod shape-determining protein MreD
MTNNYVKLPAQFALLILAQVLILNQVSVFSYAVPLLYIYFIIKLPINFNRSLTQLIAFILGLSIDAFTNSYGINSAATILVAFLRPYIQKLFFSLEDFDEVVPSVSRLGAGNFYKYAVSMVVIHHSAIFLIEYLSLRDISSLLLHIGLSSVLTLFIIAALESFSYKQRTRNERR